VAWTCFSATPSSWATTAVWLGGEGSRPRSPEEPDAGRSTAFSLKSLVRFGFANFVYSMKSGWKTGHAQGLSRSGKAPVGGYQRGPQPFGQRDVGGIVGRQDIPQLETSMEEGLMAMPGQR